MKGSLSSILLGLKHRLPRNGDWLFVTEDPHEAGEVQRDISEGLDTEQKVLARIDSSNLEALKLLYEMAKAHESTIRNSADHVRSKAGALLSTASFVSAALFGLVSVILVPATKATWLAVAEIVLFALIASHLGRALQTAVDVMRREELVRLSPESFLPRPKNEAMELVTRYRAAIAGIIACANQEHKMINKRVNKLILGQAAFGWGLAWFVFLLLLHSVSLVIYGLPRGTWASLEPASMGQQPLRPAVVEQGDAYGTNGWPSQRDSFLQSDGRGNAVRVLVANECIMGSYEYHAGRWAGCRPAVTTLHLEW